MNAAARPVLTPPPGMTFVCAPVQRGTGPDLRPLLMKMGAIRSSALIERAPRLAR